MVEIFDGEVFNLLWVRLNRFFGSLELAFKGVGVFCKWIGEELERSWKINIGEEEKGFCCRGGFNLREMLVRRRIWCFGLVLGRLNCLELNKVFEKVELVRDLKVRFWEDSLGRGRDLKETLV